MAAPLHPRLNAPIFNVLRNRNFRLLWPVGMLTAMGELSEILVMGWLILRLDGTVWQVAMVGVSRTATMFTMSLVAGALGDRFNRARIIQVVQVAQIGLDMAVLAVLLAGDIQPWHLYAVAALRGGARSFDHTSRRSLMFDVVGPRYLVQAASLDTMTYSTGKIIGPVLIGLLLQFTDTAVSAYIALGVMHGLALVASGFVRVGTIERPLPNRPVLGSINEGLKFAVKSQPIAAVLITSIFMNVVFQYTVFIPVMAQDYLHVGPGLMGLMGAADGMGTVIGAIFIGALAGKISRHGRIFLLGSAGVSVFLLLFSLSPWYALSFFLLLSLGMCQVGFATMQSGILMMASPAGYHSRVFGVQQLAIGMGHFGVLEVGALSTAFSLPLALGANSVAALVLLALMAVVLPALRHPIQRMDDPSAEEQPSQEAGQDPRLRPKE